MNCSNLSLFKVRVWSDIVSRILGYPKATEKILLNTIIYGKKFVKIISTEILKFIINTVDIIGVNKLVFTSKEEGNNSIGALKLCKYTYRRLKYV